MEMFLSNIGSAADVRKLVSQADIFYDTPITVNLDKQRRLKVVTKREGRDELIVRCKDTEERVSVVLHIPSKESSVASATIIKHT